MKTIIVTGGGGFIGSNLVEGLTALGTHRVVVCDRFGADEKWRNLLGLPVWEIITPEALPEWLRAHASEVEAMFHLGGNSSTTERDAGALMAANYHTSIGLWKLCAEHGIRFLYISSYATYGKGEGGFDDNDSQAALLGLKPLSAHGWSKHLFDLFAVQQVMSGAPKPPQWVGIKLFNAFGPREGHKEEQRSVITKMAEQAIHTGSVRLFRSQHETYPDGEQARDVIYVKDAVDVMLWMLANPQLNGLYNLGSGHAYTFRAMAQAIFRSLGREPRIHYIDMPEAVAANYQYYTMAPMGKLRAAGYGRAFTPLEAGVGEYLGYLAGK